MPCKWASKREVISCMVLRLLSSTDNAYRIKSHRRPGRTSNPKVAGSSPAGRDCAKGNCIDGTTVAFLYLSP